VDAPTRTWRQWAILWGAWLVVIIYAFPGKMTEDSVDQLLMARHQMILGDAHPPLMAYVWRLADNIVAGPFGMLLLQTGTFLFGLDAVLRRVMTPRAAAITASAVLLFPPVMTPMATIWKDSQMAGCLLVATALLLSQSRKRQIAACVVLVVATMLRYNAAAATLPLLLLLDFGFRRWRRYAVAAAVWVAITVTAGVVSGAIAEREEYTWHATAAIFDIVGTIRYVDNYSDADIERDLAGTPLYVHQDIKAKVKKVYNPRFHWWMSHQKDRVFEEPKNAEQRAAMERVWKFMLTNHTGAYLRHRLRVSREVLGDSHKGLIAPVICDPVTADYQAEAVRLSNRPSAFQRGTCDAMTALSLTWLYTPGLYFFLGILLMPLCRSRLSFAVLASGFCYELSLFVGAPSADYRYSHWMITATVIGAILAFVSRRTLKSRRSAGSPD